METVMPWIFAAFTVIGAGYFLFSIFFGDVTDDGDGEFTLLLLAAFAAGFGAVGLLGTLSEWNGLLTLAAAVGFGYLLGRAGQGLLRFVLRQQTLDSIPTQTQMIGQSGRVTIDTPEGKTGEAMFESGAHVARSAVKEVNGALLRRGDIVQVVNAESGLLYVKKKNG
jgi:hypothetical protein